jgi:hypothetical protein
MRSKSTLVLVAIGCFSWFAVNGEAIAAQSNGETATFDLLYPFLLPFGLGLIVRGTFRSFAKHESEKDGSVDPNVMRQREQLAAAERELLTKLLAQVEAAEAEIKKINVRTSYRSRARRQEDAEITHYRKRKTELLAQVEAAEAEIKKITGGTSYKSRARRQEAKAIDNYSKRKTEKRDAYKAKLRSWKKE